MRVYKILSALLLLPALYSCQSEIPQDNSPETTKENEEPYKIIVKAILPGSNDTRAQITYGNTSISEETFMWDEDDEIFIYNLSNLIDNPKETVLTLTSFDGREAIFQSIESKNPNFSFKLGDKILALYGTTYRKYAKDENGNSIKDDQGNIMFDENNIFTMDLGTEANKPQIIVEHPDNASLSYMQDNLKMFSLVTVEEDGKFPNLHFNHLSAILRVTLHNASGEDIFPTKLEFKYPGTQSFFSTTMYFSVEGDTNDFSSLKIYDGDNFYNGSKPYTDNIGTTINAKNNTDDIGESIKNGETYDLYLSTVPRINNNSKGDEVSVHLIKKHDTDYPFSITIGNFDKVIEAGKRYWFKLTATPEGTLMLTSEWNKLQQQQNSSSEGSN